MRWKALVPLRGEAMITHVIRALRTCPNIGEIIVLTQDIDAIEKAVVAGGAARMLQSSDGISASIKNVVKTMSFASPILVTTADHPLLTRDMIDQFMREADGDLAIAMVEQRTMLARFPSAKRTWLRFSDGAWSGANLFALRSVKTMKALDLWESAEKDRKQVWRLFLHFGPYLAFRALTRTIGLENALHKAGHRLGLTVKLISMTDPLAAIDVDKVGDHVLAETILASRKAS